MSSVDFDEIRQKVSCEQVVHWLGLDLKRVSTGQLRGPCPIHDGGPRALAVTPSENIWYCWAPSCRSGGGVLELVMKVKKLQIRDAALELQKTFLAPKSDAPEGLLKVVDYLDPAHPVVKAMGFDEATTRALQIGFATKGTMRGRVLIPLRNADGKLAGYIGVNPELDPVIKLPSTFYL